MKILQYLIAYLFLFCVPLTLAQPNHLESTPEHLSEVEDRLVDMTPEEREAAEKAAQDAAEDAAGFCAACGGTLLLVGIALLALSIFLLIWVARDAKNRGMDNAVLWMLLAFFLGPVGFIIYYFSRPKGELTQCSSCNEKRLTVSAQCPHCLNP